MKRRGVLAFLAWVVVLVALFAAPALWFMSEQPTSTGTQIIRGDKPQYEEGAAAFRAGVPVEANPFRGYAGSLWIRGWIDAKKQAEGAK